MTDREMLAAIMAKLEGLEEGQQRIEEKVDKLATDMDRTNRSADCIGSYPGRWAESGSS